MVETLQPLAIGISIAAPCVAFLFVVLRLYSRYYITRNLDWDEAFIVIPMILSIAQAYTTVMGIKANYVGYHVKDIPMDKYDPILGAKYNYATQLLYNPILALVKNGMLLFFLRVGGSINNVRLFIFSLIIFNTAMMVAIFVADMLQCIPVEKAFDASIEGTCIDTVSFFVATAALTILTDILVMIIPTWITWNLQLKLKKKLAVIFLLSMGLVVTGISIYRMYFLIVAFFGTPSPDATYGVGGTASSIEVNLAIAAACGPFMKPIITSFFPGFFGRDSTRRYYQYNDGPGSGALRYYGGGGASAYTASATVSSKRRSNAASAIHGSNATDPDIELQRPGETMGRYQKNVRRANTTTQSSTVAEDDEDDSSQRRIVTTVDAQDVSQEPYQSGRGRKKIKQAKDGIMMETSVDITYSKDNDESRL
ncbi:hypothetical protein VSDG_08117 [Cytospora chrysosperma]|uniref:Rhodopsin domain-containing protein n=1 Tax=Cytospora chrysosperma TaxID=252740 RepID=A0A423VFH4_CYTCH|nr:hypothetical protein VSDG_08117 [Valsa sordida]